MEKQPTFLALFSTLSITQTTPFSYLLLAAAGPSLDFLPRTANHPGAIAKDENETLASGLTSVETWLPKDTSSTLPKIFPPAHTNICTWRQHMIGQSAYAIES